MTGILQGVLAAYAGVPVPFEFTITTNQTNANLRTLSVNAGWNQSAEVICTINSGVVITSNNRSVYALTVNGTFPRGVKLINNGTIVGRGGNGGRGISLAWDQPSAVMTVTPSTAGASGGGALNVSVPLTLDNVGTIAGGGGGGGGSGGLFEEGYGSSLVWGGGGGGGGQSSLTNSSGGPGGTATGGTDANYPGNSGGTGTYSAAGAGGPNPNQPTLNGGAGGGWGAAGTAGDTFPAPASGYGSGSAGGAGGQAILGNSNITYIATGTRLGTIS